MGRNGWLVATAFVLAAGLTGCAKSDGGHGTAGAASPPAPSPAATTPPTTAPPTTVAPTTVPVATVAPTTVAPTTVAPTTGPPTTAAPGPVGGGDPTIVSSRPGIFVRTWTGHGREMTVRSDGSVLVTYRTYQFCDQDPTPPCDRTVGNEIIDGGRVQLQVQKVVTAHHTSTMFAIVLSSSDPRFSAGTVQAFFLSGDIISSPYAPLCDEKAASVSACGA